jgi:hypothetical protein
VREAPPGRRFREGRSWKSLGKVTARGVLEQGAMVQFETEARDFLLKRRHRLRRQSDAAGATAGSYWFDTEALPVPDDEEARRELARIDAALQPTQ